MSKLRRSFSLAVPSHIESIFLSVVLSSNSFPVARDQVVELLSTVIEHLVQGEIMQMLPPTVETNAATPSGDSAALDHYMRKNFYKTASLMAHSCLAAAVLGTQKGGRLTCIIILCVAILIIACVLALVSCYVAKVATMLRAVGRRTCMVPMPDKRFNSLTIP